MLLYNSPLHTPRTFGAEYLMPLITGQAVCKLRGSCSPLGLKEWNNTALPFLGLAAKW